MYIVRGFERVEEWLDQESDRAARRAMINWMNAALSGPREVASGVLQRVGRGRLLHYASVPGTGAIVTYFVLDYPVRVIVIVSVLP